MANSSAIMLPEIHVGSLNVASPKVGFPYQVSTTPAGALPGITDMRLVASATHTMIRPDGERLTGLPVSIVSQTQSLLVAAYIFRAQDLHTTPALRKGWYKGWLVCVLQDGTTFESATAILPVADR